MHARLLLWSLRHRRWRHALNALTMALTAAVIMVFASVVLDLRAYITSDQNNKYARILLYPKMMADEFPEALTSQLQRVDGVKGVLRVKFVAGRHPSGAKYSIAGEDLDTFDLMPDLYAASPEVVDAWKRERALGAIVSKTTADELRLKVGDQVEVPTNRGPLEIKVVGLTEGGRIARRIIVHYEYLQHFLGNTGFCDFRVFVAPDDVSRVSRAIDELTAHTPTPVHAASADQSRIYEAKRASIVPTVLGFVGLFLLVATALTLANSTAIAIRERRIETATMRVLGFHRRTMLAVQLLEAVMVALFGGVLAAVVCTILMHGGIDLTPGVVGLLPPVRIHAIGVVYALATCLIVPFLGTLPSARAGLRMPLVEALRDHA